MMTFPIYGKIKHVPNYQPVYIYNYIYIVLSGNLNPAYPLVSNMAGKSLVPKWMFQACLMTPEGSISLVSIATQIHENTRRHWVMTEIPMTLIWENNEKQQSWG